MADDEKTLLLLGGAIGCRLGVTGKTAAKVIRWIERLGPPQ